MPSKPNIKIKLIEELTGESLDALEPPFTSMGIQGKKGIHSMPIKLVYRVKRPKAAFLIFGTGKVVCTAKSVDDVRRVIRNVAEELCSMGIPIENQSLT